DVSAAADPCAIAPTGAAAGLDTASSASASGSCATAAEPSGMADAATTGSGETPVVDAAPAVVPAVTLPTHMGSTTRLTQPGTSPGAADPPGVVVTGGSGPATLPADATSDASAPDGGLAATTDPVATAPTDAVGDAATHTIVADAVDRSTAGASPCAVAPAGAGVGVGGGSSSSASGTCAATSGT